MTPTVAIVAPGSMGAGIGARLREHGVEVLTSLEGRSAVSAERAAAAGMRAVSAARLAECDFLLSIVPPAAAEPFAEHIARLLTRSGPVFVDCNAVSPETVTRVAARVMASGAAFVDAGIIGGPPHAGTCGPVLYASGHDAPRFAALGAYGLDIRIMGEEVGAASALKMCYAGITKGLIAVASTMLLAAERAGVADTLARELAASQQGLLGSLERTIPGMFPKAYRWVAEMRQIATFSADPAAVQIYEGAAQLYERLAPASGGREERSLLSAFLARERTVVAGARQ
jgi:L-threonate 2-dehydrogenase